MKGPVCEQTYLRNYSIGVLEALTRCELAHVLGKWKRNDTNRKQQVSANIESSMTRPEEAQLVNAMRNATSDRVRLSTLSTLEMVNPVHLPFFVTAGGLAVLDKWLRTRSECRSRVLAILEKIPVTSHDVAEARLCGAVITVSRNDLSPAKQAAIELLDR